MNNLKFDLQLHGDLIERNKYDFINQNLPNYQCFWSSFVGHNLKGYIASSNLSDKDDVEKRKIIAGLNYSIMQNLLSLDKRVSNIKNFNFDSRNADSHLELKELINGYIIDYGVIVDREEKMLLKLFNASDVKVYLTLSNKYKATRNSLQHDNDITIIMDEEFIAIPIITEHTNIQDVSWFKRYDDKNIVYIVDYVEDSYKNLVQEVNSNISKIHEELKVKWNNFKFNFPDFGKIENYAKSGVTYTENYNYDAFLSGSKKKEKYSDEKTNY